MPAANSAPVGRQNAKGTGERGRASRIDRDGSHGRLVVQLLVIEDLVAEGPVRLLRLRRGGGVGDLADWPWPTSHWDIPT